MHGSETNFTLSSMRLGGSDRACIPASEQGDGAAYCLSKDLALLSVFRITYCTGKRWQERCGRHPQLSCHKPSWEPFQTFVAMHVLAAGSE
eukprot:1159846-Pelagomonas_calceolata.AAC.2